MFLMTTFIQNSLPQAKKKALMVWGGAEMHEPLVEILSRRSAKEGARFFCWPDSFSLAIALLLINID